MSRKLSLFFKLSASKAELFLAIGKHPLERLHVH